MTIKELKEKIECLPDNMQVFIAERLTDFSYGLVNGANVKKINLSEDPFGEVLCQEIVLFLSEE